MTPSIRLYTLCVLALLAYKPRSTSAQLQRVPTQRREIDQLERRQGFGGLFGGNRDTTTSPSTSSSTATSATLGTATGGGTTPSTDPTASSTSTPLIAIPYLGTASRDSSTQTTEQHSPTSTTSLFDYNHSVGPTYLTVSYVTITSVMTNSDGSHSTMVQQSASTVPVQQSDSGGPLSKGKTWGIIGGVVGGIAVLVGAILIFWRCTQRRFGDMGGDVDEIKWPELQPDGQTVSAGLSTLNPAATRRTGRAGIEMEKDDGSEWGDDSPRLGSRPDANDSRYFDNPPNPAGNLRRGSYYDDPFSDQNYPPPPNFAGRRPSSLSSPYNHFDGSTSNGSFVHPDVYGSSDYVPLVGDRSSGIPVVRVSSPVSSHRM